MSKLKKAFGIAIVVAISSNFSFNIYDFGFIIAMSVIMLEVFIYVYNDVPLRYIIILTAILSPAMRFMHDGFLSGFSLDVFYQVFPDCFYFLAFGIIFTIINNKSITRRVPSTYLLYMLLCDILSNTTEICVRSIIFKEFLITGKMMNTILIVGLFRTLIVACIILCVETYGNLLLKNVHDEEYKRLVILNSVFESELYLMGKNAKEIENIMKKAYNLHNYLKDYEVPKYMADMSLDISKDAHEVKGDYNRSLLALRETMLSNEVQSKMSLRDLANILRSDIRYRLECENSYADVKFIIKTNYMVEYHYELISILRNLINNAVEASSDKTGKISVSFFEDEDNCYYSVANNGKAISDEEVANIFRHGYSSKFNKKTGDIYRGIGLVIVEDYVKTFFKGTIVVKNDKKDRTEFLISIPKENVIAKADANNMEV